MGLWRKAKALISFFNISAHFRKWLYPLLIVFYASHRKCVHTVQYTFTRRSAEWCLINIIKLMYKPAKWRMKCGYPYEKTPAIRVTVIRANCYDAPNEWDWEWKKAIHTHAAMRWKNWTYFMDLHWMLLMVATHVLCGIFNVLHFKNIFYVGIVGTFKSAFDFCECVCDFKRVYQENAISCSNCGIS